MLAPRVRVLVSDTASEANNLSLARLWALAENPLNRHIITKANPNDLLS